MMEKKMDNLVTTENFDELKAALGKRNDWMQNMLTTILSGVIVGVVVGVILLYATRAAVPAHA